MIEKITKEKELWKKYYKDYNNLAQQLLTDVLAYIPQDDWDKVIANCGDIIKQNLTKPLEGDIFVESVSNDIQNFKNISEEAGIAIRTLQWVEDNIKEDK